MKPILAASALLALGSVLLAGQSSIPTEESRDVFPARVKVEQFTLTRDGERTYYTTTSGEVWLYDRVARKETRIISGSAWDLSVSPLRDALAYTKGGDTRLEQYVWLLPLDPKTGLASGSERRLSTHAGDVPAISPDGKWVAFARDDSNGVGQSVVVVSARGDQERVVASGLPSSIANIRWTPDGKTLFFGVNPPVPFTCAESCLSLPGGNTQIAGTIQRVNAAGGPVAIVASTSNPLPGLSPDGTKIVFADTAGPRQLVVADTSGRRLQTFTLTPGQIQQGWLGNSLLTLASGFIRRLRAVSVSDANSPILFESDSFITASAWSPDGKTFSVLRLDDDHCELRIMDTGGTLQKTIALPDKGYCVSLAWTADQKWLVYTRYFQPDRQAITAVEIATGQTRQLRETSTSSDLNWMPDSDVVIVSEISGTAGSPRLASFRRIDLDGKATLLRELPFDEPPGSFAAPLDRSTAIVMNAVRHDVRLLRLDGGADERVVSPTQNGFIYPGLAISTDKQWVAFRINPSGNDATRMSKIELVRLDGSARKTFDLPFFAQTGNAMAILSGAEELIVSERASPGVDPGVYLVNGTTGSVKKLYEYVAQGRFPEFAVSPDGRTALGAMTETRTPAVNAMDLSQIR
jgi:Tol biopolymer transport system component